jgi:hypothetical protein
MVDFTQRQQVIDAIEHVRPQIVEGLFEAIYQNPFWEARYGERGRIHTRKDINYHLNYLVSAIALDAPASLTEYYHWVQGLLAHRGMCSRHLQDTLDHLKLQMEQMLPEKYQGTINRFMQASYDGIYYDRPASRELHARVEQIAQATAVRVFSAPQRKQASEKTRQACTRDTLYHLSYLADADHLQDAKIFRDYYAWVTEFLSTFGVRPESLAENMAALRVEIENALKPNLAAPFIKMLDGIA